MPGKVLEIVAISSPSGRWRTSKFKIIDKDNNLY